MSEEQTRKSRKSGCWFTLTILILAVAALTWKVESDTAGPVRDIVNDIRNWFSPHYTDITVTMTEGGEEILELNTYEKNINATKHVEKTFLGSTWKFDYTQQFRAKYGMRVSKSVNANNVLNLRCNIIITSLEPVGKPITASDDGWWNKITEEERNDIAFAVQEQAREQALHDNAAVQIAEQNLRAFLQKRYAGQNATFQRN